MAAVLSRFTVAALASLFIGATLALHLAGWVPPDRLLEVSGLVLAGVLTLYIQRRYYVARRVKHLSDPSRAAAGLPVGRSAHRKG